MQIKMSEGESILLNCLTTIWREDVGLKKQGFLKVQLHIHIKDNQLVITHNECKKPLKLRMGEHKSLKEETWTAGIERIMKSEMKETNKICIDLDNREWEKTREEERAEHEKKICQKKAEIEARPS